MNLENQSRLTLLILKEYFLKSSKLVNQYIWLVGLVGIFNVSFLSGALAYISLVGLLVGFFIVIVVNGRITHKIQSKGPSSPLQIIKDNWKNYLIALLTVGAPVFAFNYLLKLTPLTVEHHILLKETAKAIVWVITIYVMPIVFLKRLGFISVIAGIRYFFKHIKQSMLIIPFVAAMFLINAGGYLWAIENMRASAEILNVMPVLIVLNIASTYLSFIVFASASIVLVGINQNTEAGGKNA